MLIINTLKHLYLIRAENHLTFLLGVVEWNTDCGNDPDAFNWSLAITLRETSGEPIAKPAGYKELIF